MEAALDILITDSAQFLDISVVEVSRANGLVIYNNTDLVLHSCAKSGNWGEINPVIKKKRSLEFKIGNFWRRSWSMEGICFSCTVTLCTERNSIEECRINIVFSVQEKIEVYRNKLEK